MSPPYLVEGPLCPAYIKYRHSPDGPVKVHSISPRRDPDGGLRAIGGWFGSFRIDPAKVVP